MPALNTAQNARTKISLEHSLLLATDNSINWTENLVLLRLSTTLHRPESPSG